MTDSLQYSSLFIGLIKGNFIESSKFELELMIDLELFLLDTVIISFPVILSGSLLFITEKIKRELFCISMSSYINIISSIGIRNVFWATSNKNWHGVSFNISMLKLDLLYISLIFIIFYFFLY